MQVVKNSIMSLTLKMKGGLKVVCQPLSSLECQLDADSGGEHGMSTPANTHTAAHLEDMAVEGPSASSSSSCTIGLYASKLAKKLKEDVGGKMLVDDIASADQGGGNKLRGGGGRYGSSVEEAAAMAAAAALTHAAAAQQMQPLPMTEKGARLQRR